MNIEAEITTCSTLKSILEEMVVFAIKPGSFIEVTQESIKMGADDFKLAIYPGMVIAEAARLGTYFWAAYSAGEILAKYII